MHTFSTRRQFTASPAAIFQAIQDPARIARWWGPAGFTNKIEVFEFKVGGKWVFTMVAPDGTLYPNEAAFATIEVDHKVVIQHTNHPDFSLAITLEPSASGTLLRWDQTFADDAVAKAMQHIVEPANEQNLDRLGAELGQTLAP